MLLTFRKFYDERLALAAIRRGSSFWPKRVLTTINSDYS